VHSWLAPPWYFANSQSCKHVHPSYVCSNWIKLQEEANICTEYISDLLLETSEKGEALRMEGNNVPWRIDRKNWPSKWLFGEVVSSPGPQDDTLQNQSSGFNKPEDPNTIGGLSAWEIFTRICALTVSQGSSQSRQTVAVFAERLAMAFLASVAERIERMYVNLGASFGVGGVGLWRLCLAAVVFRVSVAWESEPSTPVVDSESSPLGDGSGKGGSELCTTEGDLWTFFLRGWPVMADEWRQVTLLKFN
jgi:hypothetical protein